MKDLVLQVTEKVRKSIEIAEKHYSRQFRLDALLFDLKGRSAGQWKYSRKDNSHTIRINRVLLEEDPQAVINQTAPHEVAHLVTYQVYGRRVAAHGSEWQGVMRDVFGLQPDRCHSIDTANSSPTPFVYTCSCPKQFRFSARRHNAQVRRKKGASRKGAYHCKTCNSELVFSHEEQVLQVLRVIDHLLVVSKGRPFGVEHAKMIRGLTKGFSVGRVTLRHDGVKGKGIQSMISALKIDAALVSVEGIGQSLPGAVSHAIFFAGPGDDRVHLAATKFRERSTVVRLLQHPGD